MQNPSFHERKPAQVPESWQAAQQSGALTSVL